MMGIDRGKDGGGGGNLETDWISTFKVHLYIYTLISTFYPHSEWII